MTAQQSSPDEIIIRQMEIKDIGAVFEIDRKITGLKRATVHSDLISGDPGNTLDLSFIAEIGGEVVGFILARRAYVGEPVPVAGFIELIGVDREVRHGGIGGKLVTAMLDRCKDRDLQLVRVMLDSRDRELQGFFAGTGFERGTLVDFNKTI